MPFELGKVFDGFFFSPDRNQRPKPFCLIGIHAHAVFPFRVEQILISSRRILLGHLPTVVADHIGDDGHAAGKKTGGILKLKRKGLGLFRLVRLQIIVFLEHPAVESVDGCNIKQITARAPLCQNLIQDALVVSSKQIYFDKGIFGLEGGGFAASAALLPV